MPTVTDAPIFLAEADKTRDSLLRHPPTDLPPLSMMRTIGSRTEEHYLTNMRAYVHDLILQAELRPSSRILDIGSGCGRVATAFMRYLNASGEYLGLDVWDEGVNWCQDHITSARPEFRFRSVPATNNYYYSADSGAGNDFKLSFVPSNHFDCIFALSVFTHLRLGDARQYFELIRRSLAPDGLAYLTFFVIDQDMHQFVKRTGQHTAVAPAGDGMWYAYERQDFFAGYEEPLLLQQFEEFGLEVVKKSRGSWAEKPGARLYQDWYLLRRR
jgi:cyclopropane fatty-acyl-phospholipid synthase-like methyltransferase